MKGRSRPTQQSDIAKAFGGRSGFASEALGKGDEPAEGMSRWERTAARLSWDDSSNHYEEYEDVNRLRFDRLVPSVELLVAGAIVLVFVGGFAAFIAALALTR